MVAKMKSNMEAVVGLFEAKRGQWISSKDVHNELQPKLRMQDVYATVSELSRSGALEKRRLNSGTGYEYQLKPDAGRNIKHTQVRRIQRSKLLNPLPMHRIGGAEDTTVDKSEATETVSPSQLSFLEDSAVAPTVPVKQIPPGVKGRAPRVVWTPEEKQVIANEVVRLQQEQPHLSLMNAVKKAQQALPEGRRRHSQIQNKHHIPWIDEYVAHAKAAASKTATVQTPSPVAVLPPETVPVVEARVEPEPQKPALETALPPTAPAEVPGSAELLAFADKAAQLVKQADFTSTGALVDILLQRFSQVVKRILLDVLGSDELRSTLTAISKVPAVQAPAAPDPRTQTAKAPQPIAQPSVSAVPEPAPVVQAAPTEPTVLTETPAPAAMLKVPVPAEPPVEDTRRPEVAVEPALEMAQTTAPEKPKLKRVLVMGLIPNQIQEITQEFKGALDLRFWRTDQSINLLKALVKQVDQTVVMTDFIAHAHEGLVKNADVPFVRQPGGVSRLKDTLTHIFAHD